MDIFARLESHGSKKGHVTQGEESEGKNQEPRTKNHGRPSVYSQRFFFFFFFFFFLVKGPEWLKQWVSTVSSFGRN